MKDQEMVEQQGLESITLGCIRAAATCYHNYIDSALRSISVMASKFQKLGKGSGMCCAAMRLVRELSACDQRSGVMRGNRISRTGVRCQVRKECELEIGMLVCEEKHQ
ncbi:hypothetical protein Ciccas_007439 [Cichlidogyrus casuarinus]|uniref:Uncharacterized protein n=1 Tax=Cichlidogyrus casuarinus TaxID=1844966 RepID=A0ABD2Q2W3_9PLAT